MKRSPEIRMVRVRQALMSSGDRGSCRAGGAKVRLYAHIFEHHVSIPLGFSYSYSARRAVLVLDLLDNRGRERVPFH